VPCAVLCVACLWHSSRPGPALPVSISRHGHALVRPAHRLPAGASCLARLRGGHSDSAPYGDSSRSSSGRSRAPDGFVTHPRSGQQGRGLLTDGSEPPRAQKHREKLLRPERAPRRRRNRGDHAASPSMLFDTGVRALPQDRPRKEGLDQRRRRELGSLADALERQKERLSLEEFAPDLAPEDARRYLGANTDLPLHELDQLLLWEEHTEDLHASLTRGPPRLAAPSPAPALLHHRQSPDAELSHAVGEDEDEEEDEKQKKLEEEEDDEDEDEDEAAAAALAGNEQGIRGEGEEMSQGSERPRARAPPSTSPTERHPPLSFRSDEDSAYMARGADSGRTKAGGGYGGGGVRRWRASSGSDEGSRSSASDMEEEEDAWQREYKHQREGPWYAHQDQELSLAAEEEEEEEEREAHPLGKRRFSISSSPLEQEGEAGNTPPPPRPQWAAAAAQRDMLPAPRYDSSSATSVDFPATRVAAVAQRDTDRGRERERDRGAERDKTATQEARQASSDESSSTSSSPTVTALHHAGVHGARTRVGRRSEEEEEEEEEEERREDVASAWGALPVRPSPLVGTGDGADGAKERAHELFVREAQARYGNCVSFTPISGLFCSYSRSLLTLCAYI